MSIKLKLSCDTDSLSLSGQEDSKYGVQAIAGATGLGLPPRAVRFVEGAADGGQYRGQRRLMRPIDLPLNFRATDHEHLQSMVATLARILSDDATLTIYDDLDTWIVDVALVGGGDWAMGVDSTETELNTTISLQAFDPFFTGTQRSTLITAAPPSGLLTASLSKLNLSSKKTLGVFELNNLGDVTTYPVWIIKGPFTDVTLTGPYGDVLKFEDPFTTGQTLTIDTRPGHGTVVDQSGNNRYDGLAPRPKFWSIPRGLHVANAALNGTGPTTSVECKFQARRWAVI